MAKISQKEPIERVVVKIPRSTAQYFRKAFPHGKRSVFVARCIEEYRKNEELREIEDDFREMGKSRI